MLIVTHLFYTTSNIDLNNLITDIELFIEIGNKNEMNRYNIDIIEY